MKLKTLKDAMGSMLTFALIAALMGLLPNMAAAHSKVSPISYANWTHYQDHYAQIEDRVRSWKCVESVQRNAIVNKMNALQVKFSAILDRAVSKNGKPLSLSEWNDIQTSYSQIEDRIRAWTCVQSTHRRAVVIRMDGIQAEIAAKFKQVTLH